ncbi:hypothetical protein [Luteolibacter sp. Populi]|uniref:hypothetical protein n=1 Tax=Luteolibacter sp. Populi TaxID=3230487 RepID=UPI0034668E3A
MLTRALSLLLLMAAPLAAQQSLFLHQPDPKSLTKVEANALFSHPAPGGFLPVRITVNNAGDQDGNIDIRCVANDGSSGGQGSEVTSSFKLGAPAGKLTRHDILIPCSTLLNFGYGDGSVQVSLAMSGSFGSNSGNLSARYGDTQPAVLLSEALFTPNGSMLDAEIASKSGSRGGANFAAKFDPHEMPDDWRAYSGFDGLALTDSDWTTLSPGARTAILRWNRLGGRLVILAVSTNSDLATLGISDLAAGERSAIRSFGNVSIEPINNKLTLDKDGVEALVDRFTNKDNLPALNTSIRSDFSSAWPLQGLFDPKSYNYGLFIVILIAFGILVGPVNLFVFAKSGRRHRLFITTPLIALGTSVLLIGLIILIDGFGGRGIRVTLMEVRPDDGENAAYVYQEQVSRTGVLLGAGFTVAEPAAITPVPLSSGSQWSRLTDDNNGGGMRYEANLRDGKLEVEGDWFQSRSEQGQFVRAIVPGRGRIELRNADGPPSMISTFDFPIERIYYVDAAGGYWCGENIERGKAFNCREAQQAEVADFVKDASAKLSARTRKALKSLDPLERGSRHFIAVTDKAPGIATFEGIKWTSSTTYITGPVVAP